MNLEKGYVEIEGNNYEINDTNFPTLIKDNIYELTDEEKEVVERLCESFKNSPKLNEHIDFLYKKENYIRYLTQIYYSMRVFR